MLKKLTFYLLTFFSSLTSSSQGWEPPIDSDALHLPRDVIVELKRSTTSSHFDLIYNFKYGQGVTLHSGCEYRGKEVTITVSGFIIAQEGIYRKITKTIKHRFPPKAAAGKTQIVTTVEILGIEGDEFVLDAKSFVTWR